MWLKYSDKEIRKADLLEYRDQIIPTEPLSRYSKPNGCWITDDSDYCWRSWCIDEKFMLHALTHKHELTLDESNILILRDTLDMQEFNDRYGMQVPWQGASFRRHSDLLINWRKVATDWAGLIITPYHWSLRMENDFSWYYGWDCASGCIWNPEAILDVKLIEVNEMTEKENADA